MDFILPDDCHEEHDSSWTVFSHHYTCFVCLGCIVEILEDTQKLCIQKKPALSELLRLLTCQSGDLLQLFRLEERIVWHLAEILLDCYKEVEESFLSSAIDTSLKLMHLIGSEDLVMFFLDAIHKQVMTHPNHEALFSQYTLLGKMVFQLPPLAEKLIHDYDQLLHQISMDLSSPRETIQSAVAYLFIYLCDRQLLESMSPRLKQQIYHGVVKMLATVQTQAVQINGLGLLKKLLVHEESCHILMAVNIAGSTLISVLKKLLLSKKEVIQIGVTQILSQLLQKQASSQYGAAILESDLAGIESVLRTITTALELKNPQLLKLGYTLLAEVLQRQPVDIPLFMSVSVVRSCLSLIENGVMHLQISVSLPATKAASAILRKEHLKLPVPFLELSSLLMAVASKAWNQLKDVGTEKVRNKTKNHSSERETREDQLQTYTSLLLNSVRLASQCKCEPATCESSFTAPPTSATETVPTLQSYSQLVLQVIDENWIPLFMIHWNNTENVTTCQQYFDILVNLRELDLSVSEGIIIKLVETGFLSDVLKLKAKFWTETVLVESIDKFLVLALTCALVKEEFDTVDLDCFKDTVKKMTFDLSLLRQAMFEDNLEKDAVEMYITVLYLCYRNSIRPLQAEELQCVLSSVLENYSSLEELSPLACRHFLYLLAWSAVNEGIDMRSGTSNGLQSLSGILNKPKEKWYTHDIVLLQWCFSNNVMASLSGTSVLNAYLESCALEEVTGENYQQEFNKLCWNPSFRHSLLACIAQGTPDTVRKAMIVEYCLVQPYVTSLPNDLQMEEDRLNEVYTSVTEMLQKIFLRNVLGAKEHNLIALLELLLKVQKMVPASCGVDVKILYHVLNQFGPRKKLSAEFRSICLQFIAVSMSACNDNQVAALVIQNKDLLCEVEMGIKERWTTLAVSCDILTSLISSSSITQAPYIVSLHLPCLVNFMLDVSTDCQKAILHLLEKLFQCHLVSPVIKLAAGLSQSGYHTLYISLQQFVVQDHPDLQEAAVSCLEKIITYLMATDNELGAELLNQPWNHLMLDILVELSLDTGLSSPVVTLLRLFLGHDSGTTMITSMKKLPKVIQHLCTNMKGSEDRLLAQKLAAQVLEKLSSVLSQANRDFLLEFTTKSHSVCI